MALKFTHDVMVKNPYVSMTWQQNRFITQNGDFFHGAVQEYEHPETGKRTGVAFLSEGDVYVIYDEAKGEAYNGQKLFAKVKAVANANKQAVAENAVLEASIEDYTGAFPIYRNGVREETFDPEYWLDEFTADDIEDIENRIEDLKTYDTYVEA